MKKIMMIAAMMLLSVGAFAQEAGKMAIGVNGAYGIASNYKTFGVGAKFQYAITDDFRAEASGTYFFKKDYTSAWDANLNVHYVIPISEGLNVYPLVGATVFGVKVDASDAVSGGIAEAARLAGMTEAQFRQYAAQYGIDLSQYEDAASASETRVGFNAGAGIEYFLSPSFKINLEAKYQYTKDSDWPVISVGAAYVF